MTQRWVGWLCCFGIACKGSVATDPTDRPPLVVRQGPSVPCADPTERATTRFRRFELPDPNDAGTSYLWGAGIVASELDGDAALELVTVRATSLEYLDWTGTAWIDHPGMPALHLERGFGIVAFDSDSDGDRDLFVTQMGGVNHLLLNDGQGNFQDTTPPILAGSPTQHNASATVADFDGDGTLDLFIAGHGQVDEVLADPTQFAPADPSRLLLHQQGAWVDASHRIPSDAHDRYTFIGGAQDLDGDGDVDLLMVNDFGRRYSAGQLLWNTEQGFVADGNHVGLDLNVAGMGLSWADLNQDRTPDALVPFWGGYRVMISNSGSWFDSSATVNLRPGLANDQQVGWGAAFGDLNNDAHLDAVVMHGWLDTRVSPNVHDQPDALFLGGVSGFDNVTASWNHIDEGDNRGLVVADFDGDGWLDLARPSLNGPTVLYMATCGNDAWLEVVLRQPAPNPEAIGAVVRAWVGDEMLTRYSLVGGHGYGSSGPAALHFGLGSARSVDLEIRWPDGRVDRVRGLETNQHVEIERSD